MFNKVTVSDRLLFTKHLSLMVKAGIPIAEALSSLASHTSSPAFKKVLTSVVSGIENGKTLAYSLNQQKRTFDNFFISLIEVGEESGTLEDSLEFLVEQLTKDYALRSKIQGAMLYPILVLSSTFGMGGFIAFFILPKLINFFTAFEMELPLATRILLFIAQFMKSYGIYTISAAAAVIVLLPFIIRLPSVKPRFHRSLLKLPFFGKIVSAGQLSQFSRNLGILLKSGVPINRSLEVTAQALNMIPFKNDVKTLARSLMKGKNMSDVLDEEKLARFPPIVSQMVAVGEKTGKLDETLVYLSTFYEDEIDTSMKNLTTLLEPILLIIVGFAVGFIALAIISPIYQFTSAIR